MKRGHKVFFFLFFYLQDCTFNQSGSRKKTILACQAKSEFSLHPSLASDIWDKVFKNGVSEIRGKWLLKNLKCYALSYGIVDSYFPFICLRFFINLSIF